MSRHVVRGLVAMAFMVGFGAALANLAYAHGPAAPPPRPAKSVTNAGRGATPNPPPVPVPPIFPTGGTTGGGASGGATGGGPGGGNAPPPLGGGPSGGSTGGVTPGNGAPMGGAVAGGRANSGTANGPETGSGEAAGGTTGGGRGGATPAPAPVGGGAPALPRGGASTATPTPGAAPDYRGGTTPSYKKPASMESANTWNWWWQFNRERFMSFAFDPSDRSRTNVSNDADGRASLLAEYERDRDVLRGQSSSLLRRALLDADPAVRAEAVFALGKAGAAEHLGDIESMLADNDLVVRRHAILALGLLGEASSIPTLVAIADNAANGRKVLGGISKVDEETRSYAAMALGYLGARTNVAGTQAVDALARLVNTRHSTNELNVAGALALGFVHSSSAVTVLLDALKDTSVDENVRSACANSLGKIGDRSALPSLIDALKDKRLDVRRSAAIALGLLATEKDAAAVAALTTAARSGADRATRNFALIALGEVGGLEAKSSLFGALESDDSHDQTFGALALGILCSKHDDADRKVIGERLLAKLDACDDCPRRGAMILALGVIGHQPASDSILELMRTHEHPDLRIYAAQSLGMLGADVAVDDLIVQMHDSSSEELQAAASTALGQIGSQKAMAALGERLRENASVALGGAAVRGLGKDGNRNVIFAFGRWLGITGEKHPEYVRSFAALALGIIGDKDRQPMCARLANNSNYIAQYQSLQDLFSKI